jgi:hypothetical protein
VLYLLLIILSVVGDILVDSKTFLVTDFVSLNISRSNLSDVLIRIVYACVFIGVNARASMSICVYIVFIKKKIDQA